MSFVFRFLTVVLLAVDVSTSAQVFHKEQPVLAGIDSGKAAWQAEEPPLDYTRGWQTMPNGPNNVVLSISGETNGNIIVGGAFDTIAGTAVGRVVAYNNGTWVPLGNGVDNGTVYATAQAQYQSSVGYASVAFAAGSFSHAGRVGVHNIAQWDDSVWLPLADSSGEGLDSTVLALAVSGDSLFVGGNFTHAGGITVNHIAIWNITKKRWEQIIDHGIVGVDGGVAALAVPYESSDVYLGGGFIHAGSIVANKIVRFSKGEWQALGNGVRDSDGIIECIYARDWHWYSQNIVVGGHFSTIGDSAASDIARWDLTDSTWHSALQTKFVHGAVYAVTNPVNLYVGGDFVDSTGAIKDFYGSTVPAPPNGPVYALLGLGGIFPEGYSEYIYVGGEFTTPSTNFAGWLDSYGIAQHTSQSPVTISPNPVSSSVNFEGASGLHNVEIMNALGETMKRVSMLHSSSLDVNDLPPGIYFLRFDSASQTVLQRFIKE